MSMPAIEKFRERKKERLRKFCKPELALVGGAQVPDVDEKQPHQHNTPPTGGHAF